MGMIVTFYIRPFGNARAVEIENIDIADEKWFKENDVLISMEESSDEYIIYADIGRCTEDGDPDEVIVFSSKHSSETCNQAMKRLRVLCEEALVNER